MFFQQASQAKKATLGGAEFFQINLLGKQGGVIQHIPHQFAVVRANRKLAIFAPPPQHLIWIAAHLKFGNFLQHIFILLHFPVIQISAHINCPDTSIIFLRIGLLHQHIFGLCYCENFRVAEF